MTSVDTKIRALRDELSVDIALEAKRTDQVLTSIQSMQIRIDDLDQQRSDFNVNANGTANGKHTQDNSPELSVTVSGIPQTEEEDLLLKVNDLMKALGEDVYSRLKLENRTNDSNFLVFACYLPPENSSRGRDAPSFFAHLLAQIYLNDECDAILLTGDFNSRIGSLPDTLNDIDCVPMRNTIDKSINQHGHEFIDFLNESKFCVLNGRFQGCDNFTSISTRGKSVVDYICVPHDVFDKCKKFEVLTAESIVNNNSLFGLLGGKSRLPDHSVLITEFTVTHFEQAVSTRKINISNDDNIRYRALENEKKEPQSHTYYTTGSCSIFICWWTTKHKCKDNQIHTVVITEFFSKHFIR
ncbi:unnamed protein product [Mytilus edulis]|uniref:Endonuclease/exonuclease/phosphatase domain-containing protein n=1 Tax=Mytilus edulis TaxID=6550 RepID=A0A8S3VQV6_MYTED|nr:unnamed protein product [Mytilus edulis]